MTSSKTPPTAGQPTAPAGRPAEPAVSPAGRHRQDGSRLRAWLAGIFTVHGRNIPVDTLRGVACIFLVTFHVIGYSASDGIQVSDDSGFRYYTDSVDYLRMPLFTLLSGLVYAWRPLRGIGKYGAFMRKKARRLLVPYVIFVPLIGLFQTYASGTNTTRQLEPWNWLLYSLSPYWFLLTTFWLFAVVALLDSLDLVSTRTSFGALFAGSLLVVLLSDTEAFRVLQVGQALTLAPFFLAGIGMVRFNLIPRRMVAKVTMTVLLVAVIVLVQLSLNGVFDPFDSRHSIVGIGLGILFPLVFLGWKLSNRPLAWIGGYSSGIFLLHSFAVGGCRAIMSVLGIEADAAEFVVLSLGGIFLSIVGVIVLRQFQAGKFILGESTAPRKQKATA
ncbi:MAG: acyltransferase family protein [Mycobacteriaceae bacterium]|uniref:acyltransferase family protein n=1 Tax=Corynebacterium sp. TaxID=1720 RepID=UPI003F947C76